MSWHTVESVEKSASQDSPLRAFADEVVYRFVLHVTEGACFADKVRFVFVEVIVDCSMTS